MVQLPLLHLCVTVKIFLIIACWKIWRIQRNVPRPALIEKPVVVCEKGPSIDLGKKRRSLKILLAYLSIAALFFIVVSLNNLFKAKPVALIKDSMNAKWSDIDLTAGCTIFDSDGFLKLESGVVKLEYEDATVILEGPCVFASESSNQIKMLSGSAYVKMIEGKKGYIVENTGFNHC